MQRLVCLAIGYLLGSFLTAEVVARHVGGGSSFGLGDGNPGMANIGHELGKSAALACLAGDILKTVLAVVVARVLFPLLGVSATGWAGLGATLGHIFPFWHHFRGGKGVTTIASTIVLMSPLWGAAAGVVGVATIILAGYLSVGAVAAIAFYTIAALFVLPLDCALVSAVFCVLTCMAHGSKLVGIRRGTTRRASLSVAFWNKVRPKS